MAVGRSISDGDPRAVWGSFSRLDQSPTPYTRPYPSTIAIVKERNKKEMLRLGLLRYGCIGQCREPPPLRWPIEIRSTSNRTTSRWSRPCFSALVRFILYPQIFFLPIDTCSPARVISPISKGLGTRSHAKRGANFAALSVQAAIARSRECWIIEYEQTR